MGILYNTFAVLCLVFYRIKSDFIGVIIDVKCPEADLGFFARAPVIYIAVVGFDFYAVGVIILDLEAYAGKRLVCCVTSLIVLYGILNLFSAIYISLLQRGQYLPLINISLPFTAVICTTPLLK